MAKIDLTKKYKSYFSYDLRPRLSSEQASFLVLTGTGEIAGRAFSEDVKALYAVVYGVKFLSKLRERDFIVSKLESSWSYDGLQFNQGQYTLRIRMPDHVFKKEVMQALDVARLKKKVLPTQDIVFEEIPINQLIDFTSGNV